jgi:hypothetical protein
VGSHAAHQGLSRVTPVGTCPLGLSVLGVSHALDGFLRHRPCELLSSRYRVRVSPSGVCPSIRVRSGFLRTFPLLPLSIRACGFPRQLACRRLQGFAPRFECGDQRDGLDHARSAPLLEFALFGSIPFRSWHSLSGCLRLQPSPR